MSKVISMYGSKYVMKRHTYKQRYWKTRKDGVKQRYWIKVTRQQRYRKGVRFDIEGSGKELYKAIKFVMRKRLVPRERHIEVEAEEFLRHPYWYSELGEWTTKRPDIETP